MKLEKSTKLILGLIAFALVLIGRLFQIQIVDDQYKTDASNNSMVHVPVYPSRGMIKDRNGKVLVGNKVCYDIMVTPKEVSQFDTLTLCRIFGVSKEWMKETFDGYRKNMSKIGYQSVALVKQVDQETYMKFAEVAHQFPGFRGQTRTVRQYPFNAGGNLLGYVSEVDADFIAKHPGEYKVGDYAGKTGIEAAREADLRGVKGDQVFLRNSRNKIEKSYKNGELDVDAIPGKDIITTIDADLQRYGQRLMRNKVGAVVAIEPSSGEILAIVSSPGIDVDMLADIGKHYNEIASNPYKPMFNRAVQASYPPGSVFKIATALMGLQEGVLKPSTRYACSMGYHYGDKKLGCHSHKSPIDMEESIMMSCNAYYCYVLKSIIENKKYQSVEEGFNKWNEYAHGFGFGQKLGTDLPSELGGNIPSAEFYNKRYGKGHWKANTVISISIGQGEIGCTPLHIANFCATIANRGYYYIPHIVKESEGITIDPKFKERQYTLVDTTYFPMVIKGMYKAVNAGKGSGATAYGGAIPGIVVCGKTGTAENPHGADNSVFMCFAPMDNPKIAVAVYVENAGFGATWAVPIGSLMVEKYLKGEISTSERKDMEARVLSGYLLDRVRVK